MRRLGLLWLVLTGCSTAPPIPAPGPAPVATPAEPRLGRVADAEQPAAEEQPSATPEPQAPAPLPHPENATLQPPPQYEVVVESTLGRFVVLVDSNQAPSGAKRFYNLAMLGYYNNATFFRAIAGFMVQFGVHGDPEVNRLWKSASITDDPVNVSNVRGTVVFAKSGRPNSATTQLFINLTDNPQLDIMGFAPIGHVSEGMDVVDQIYTGYGEGAPSGKGPSQGQLMSKGEAHLSEFPLLTRIISMSVR